MDDLPTRVTLVERTMISREALVDREEKLLSRFEELLKRDRQQASEERRHEFKMYGHETGEQLRTWSAKIHMERDEILEKRDAADRAKEDAAKDKSSTQSPLRTWLSANWIWVACVGILVVVLRPDLATAVVRLVM
ncbi:hypothetical protein [Hyphomonas sp.]|uniref:hypothetical protein n=1 Tax=Hyphomonas sp. TaxID=87 RepID=UPI00356317BF